MTKIRVDFNTPATLGNEMQYIAQSIEGGHLSGDGPFTRQCHALLEQLLNVPKALLTTSCTHALEMMALLLEIGPGDEVIFPDFTFVSTVNAFVLRGATPVFVDIRPDTLNLDEKKLKSAITPRTRAIVPVHYAGVACEMDEILALAGQHQIAVLEDNAHGLFGKYKGKWLGTFGQMAAQSFHETKNFTSGGEGGALLLNDPSLVERAEIIREKGTNRSRFFRGEVDKYSWVDIGSSYLLSDLLAAFLYAQLELHEKIQSRRQQIWDVYAHELAGWARKQGVDLPFVPGYVNQAYHMFYILLPDLRTRQRFIQSLRDRGIYAVFHYLPLHLSEMGQRFGGCAGDCPVTESVSDRLVRLPFHNVLTDSQQELVLQAILDFQV